MSKLLQLYIGGVVKARQVIPLQARQDWNSDLPAGGTLLCAALHNVDVVGFVHIVVALWRWW